MAIEVRFATESDFRAVLEMSEGAFDGHDIVPGLYHNWLKREDHIVLLAMLDDKPVGLCAFCFIDEGVTTLAKGLRIHPQFRGRGFGREFVSAARHFVKQRYPSVVRERYMTASINAQRLAISKKTNDIVLFERDSYLFHVKPSPLLKFKLQLPSLNSVLCPIRPYDKQELKKLLSSSQERLFTQGIMLLNSWPLEATPSNVEHIYIDDNRFSCIFGDAVYPLDGRVKSFSHGILDIMPSVKHWRASLFTTGNERLLKVHVCEHLKVACQIIDEDFYFRVSHDKSDTVKRQVVRFLENELGLERDMKRYGERYTSLVLEKQL